MSGAEVNRCQCVDRPSAEPCTEWSRVKWSGVASTVDSSRVESNRVESNRVESSRVGVDVNVEWIGVEWSGVEWSGVAWRGVAPVSVPRCTSRESRTDRTTTAAPHRALTIPSRARIRSYSILS